MREGESGVYEGLLGVECDVLLWGEVPLFIGKKPTNLRNGGNVFF